MAKVIQINLNRSRGALDLAIEQANRTKHNIICITEPPRLHNGKLLGISGWEQVSNENAAVLYRKSITNIEPVTLEDEYTVAIKLGSIVLVSTYAPPNTLTDLPFNGIGKIVRKHSKVIITGDMNCRTRWTSNLPMRLRDMEFEKLLSDHGLKVENSNIPTLLHQGRATINDYTLTKGSTINNWSVLEEEVSLSDHYYITFWIVNEEASNNKQFSKKLDEEKFNTLIEECLLINLETNTPEEVEMKATMVTEWIKENIEKCTIEKEVQPKTLWWNNELDEMREKIKKLRRTRYRTKNVETKNSISKEIKMEQQNLRNKIRKAKISKWKEFVGMEHPWGKPYKLIVKPRECKEVYSHLEKENQQVTKSRVEAMQYLMKTKIPEKAPAMIPMSNAECEDAEMPDEITADEIAEVLKKSKNRSAPGFDQINYKALKRVNKKHPSLLLDLYNSCLRYCIFPKEWKLGKLIWLQKQGKDVKSPGAYRPLTLLSILGKTLERIIAARISSTITLSNKQYGFRKGIGAEDCLHDVVEEVKSRRLKNNHTAMVSLDISGAFDHISWPHTLRELRNQGVNRYLIRMIESYCTDRYVQDKEGNKKKLVCGCPQGSVVAPLLWNIGYDCVIKELSEKGYNAYVYADDTMIIVSEKSRMKLFEKIKNSIITAENKMKVINLKLNKTKTDIIVLGSIISAQPVEEKIKIGEQELHTKREVKYLGMVIDNQLSWDSHLEYLKKKSDAMLPKLLSMCQNTFGYSTEARRTMLRSTIFAYYKYGTTSYIHAL